MNRLNILWTTTNKDTVTHMISMYAINALKNGWWKEVNVIIWGGSAKLVAENPEIQSEVRKMLQADVTVEGCLVCSDGFGVSEDLKKLGVDLKFMGEPLTNYLKGDEKVLSI